MEFKTRSDQLAWVVSRFTGWLSQTCSELGLPLSAKLSQISAAPATVQVAIALDLAEKYGSILHERDLSAAMKIIVEFSDGKSQQIALNGTKFIEALESDKEKYVRFFNYTDAILCLIESP